MVAIILVNYNGYKDTYDCILSLEKCKNLKYEIIVVDNCSANDSVEMLEKMQTEHLFTLLKSKENKGFSAGNNIGINYALAKNAEYILLLNNDTIVEPNFLNSLIAEFSINQKCGVTISKILYEDKRDTIWYAGGSLSYHTGRTEHWEYNKLNKSSNLQSKKVSFVTGCCMCIKSDVIKKIGLMNENYFLYEEDAEYSYRILNSGYEMIYVPSSVIYHKVSSSTGIDSPLSQYYTVRNKYYMIYEHFKGFNKVIAYIYTTTQMLFRCFKGLLSFNNFFKGLKAFRKKEIGKREI